MRSPHMTLKRAGAAVATAVGSFALAVPAFATNLRENVVNQLNTVGTGSGLKGTEEKTLQQLLGGYINAALGLLGVILVVLVIYAGFLWMTAGGNEEKVKKAKTMLTNAVIGIVIIMAAYAITNFVIGAVLPATT